MFRPSLDRFRPTCGSPHETWRVTWLGTRHCGPRISRPPKWPPLRRLQDVRAADELRRKRHRGALSFRRGRLRGVRVPVIGWLRNAVRRHRNQARDRGLGCLLGFAAAGFALRFGPASSQHSDGRFCRSRCCIRSHLSCFQSPEGWGSGCRRVPGSTQHPSTVRFGVSWQRQAATWPSSLVFGSRKSTICEMRDASPWTGTDARPRSRDAARYRNGVSLRLDNGWLVRAPLRSSSELGGEVAGLRP